MTAGNRDVVHPRSGLTPGRLAGVALALTCLGAGFEVLILYFQKRTSPLLLHVSADVVWMAPLALLTIAGAIIGVCALIGRVWKPDAMATLMLFFTALVVGLDLLMLVPGLSHAAAAILAAGLAVQVSRLAARRADALARGTRRWGPWVLGAGAIAGTLMWVSLRPAALASPAQPASPGRPNLLVITLDTVRADSLGLYGFSGRTSPGIDTFAAGGVVFDRAFSTAPWTLPSHASLFTGRWPHELSAGYASPLDGRYPTLAEYLSGHGYRTAGFVANYGYCGAASGLARGFQHYEDYPRSLGQIASSSTLVRNVADNFRLRRLVKNDQHMNRLSAPELNARALDWLSANGGAPFFMFLNYFDAHEPYLPPPPFDRQFGPGRREGQHSPLHHWLWNPAVAHGNMGDAERTEEVNAYHGAIANLDHHVNALLAALAQRGVLDQTLVVITSDHGEEFAEHGVYEHGYSLYRAGVHVPLVVVLPGRVPGGRRIATPVSLHDLAPTIVELLGMHTGAPFPGPSLAALWTEAGRAADSPAGSAGLVLSEVKTAPGQPEWFPTSKGDMTAVVHRGVRYIRNGDGSEELYDLVADPDERHNLVAAPDRQTVLAESRARADRR